MRLSYLGLSSYAENHYKVHKVMLEGLYIIVESLLEEYNEATGQKLVT
jgi:hypothetical protein